MERPNPTTHVTERRKLGYDNTFRQFIREHPGVVKTAIELTQRAEEQYDPPDAFWGILTMRWDKESNRWFEIAVDGKERQVPLLFNYQRGTMLRPGETQIDEQTGLEITVLGISNRDLSPMASPRVTRTDRSSYFKVALDGKTFFLKKSTSTTNPGFDEFSNTTKLKTELKDLSNVNLVEAQLGYQDRDQSWYVSRWENLAGFITTDPFGTLNPVSEYGEIFDEPESFMQDKEYEKVKQVKEEIKTRAAQVGIVAGDLSANLFYNPTTKEYLFLDITSEKGERLNQPV